MADLSDILSRALPELVRGGLWARGGEVGTIPKAEFDARDFRVLITRLSSYEDTSLSFTHDILYALCAERGWFPDWSFLPPPADRETFARLGLPWLFGVQSWRDARDFDLIAFSNSISQEMGNVLWFLRNSGIPIEKSLRMDDPDIPLVIMGGANAGSASAFMSPEPPIDGIFVGEDLDEIARLFGAARECRLAGMSKRETLARLCELPGFFEPNSPRPVKKLNARTFVPSDLYARMPVNRGEGNAGKATLAISEGCAGFCSFCAESFARKPYRENPSESALAEARRLKAETGADKIDLFSFNFNMHRDFYRLIEGLVPLFPEIGLKSQRFDSIAEDPALIEVEKALGKSVFTCGLEGISDRLRRFLNKNLSDAQVRKSIETLVAASVREIKVFLIATAREGREDLDEWTRLLSWIGGLRTPLGKQVRFVFSVTPLVRFPHTPLEFEPAPSLDRAREAVAQIVNATKAAGFECRAAASAEESLFCDMLVRAPSPAVYAAFRDSILESQFVYDREVPESAYRLFMRKLSSAGVDPEALRAAYSPENNAVAPWARLDLGISRKYLEHQYAMNSSWKEASPDPSLLCGKGRPRPDRQAIEALKYRIAEARKDARPVSLAITLGDRWLGVPREYPALLVARALMAAEGALVPLYRGYVSSFWENGSHGEAPLFGKDVLTLSFSGQGSAYLSSRKAAFWQSISDALAGESISVAGSVSGSAGSSPAGVCPALVCRLVMDSPFDVNAEWLLRNGLKHTYAKDGEGRSSYQFSKDALKKGIIESLGVERLADGSFRATVSPGPKFKLSEFLEGGFRCVGKAGWRRIRVEAK